jgi:hypothetical protein
LVHWLQTVRITCRFPGVNASATFSTKSGLDLIAQRIDGLRYSSGTPAGLGDRRHLETNRDFQRIGRRGGTKNREKTKQAATSGRVTGLCY